jgi:uncharacterized membrane protein
MSKSRIEIFSDAVLAIIMTILVLNLHAPTIPSGASLREYSFALLPLLPNLVSFILSFIMIAIYWINHHNFFIYIKEGTVGLAWANIFLLLTLSLLPFPTALLGAHPTDQFPIILYSTNLFLCSIAFYFLRHYARRHNLLKADCDQKELLSPKQSLPAMILSLLSITLSFLSVYLSLLCLLIFPIIYVVPKSLWRMPARKTR